MGVPGINAMLEIGLQNLVWEADGPAGTWVAALHHGGTEPEGERLAEEPGAPGMVPTELLVRCLDTAWERGWAPAADTLTWTREVRRGTSSTAWPCETVRVRLLRRPQQAVRQDS